MQIVSPGPERSGNVKAYFLKKEKALISSSVKLKYAVIYKVTLHFRRRQPRAGDILIF